MIKIKAEKVRPFLPVINMIKINVVRRKLIKPCIPTPQNIKTHKISYIDELAPSMNIGVLLFYPSRPETTIVVTQKLQQSLRKILAQFYPLAGRYIKSDYSVDCTDQGAEFVEAEAFDIELAALVGKTEQLNDLLPRRSYQVDEATDPLLSVQITYFNRGGLVIGISVSHRISDTSSLATFISAWSNATNNSAWKTTIIPSFDESPAFFPSRNIRDNPYGEPSQREDTGVVFKRFCFNKEAISSVRSKLTTTKEGKRGISKVLVVSALIAKALIGVDRAKHARSKDCYINHAVNMRGRTVPQLHKHACGNLILQSLTRSITAAETAEMGIKEMVDLMGDTIRETISGCAEILSLGSDGVDEFMVKPAMNALPRVVSGEAFGAMFSDWSKFGFYETDFGWGKPVWVGVAPLHDEDVTVLMENRDGDGIEAWVHLHKNDMHLFEQDKRIRLFTT